MTSNPAPTVATASVTPGAPIQRATWASGLSAWLNARRAHGKPPYGVVPRAHSCDPTERDESDGKGPVPGIHRAHPARPTTPDIAAM